MPITSFLCSNLNFDKNLVLNGIDDFVAKLPEMIFRSTNRSSFPIVSYKKGSSENLSVFYPSCEYALSFHTVRKTYVQTVVSPAFSVKSRWPDNAAKVEECIRTKMVVIQDIPRTDKSRVDNGNFSSPRITKLNPLTIESGLVYQEDKLEGPVKTYWWSYFNKVLNPLLGYLSFVNRDGFNESKAREKTNALR